MNVKEVEDKTGITRANIRFYETKELIEPKRSDNGYRDYSEEDVERLKKIKLLRCLQISIEEIRELEYGKVSLKDIMDNNIIKLEKDANKYETFKEVNRKIIEEVEDYSVLDAGKYLEELEESETYNISRETLKEDTLDPDGCAWCRYFARMIDIGLIVGILNYIAPKALHSWVDGLNTTMSVVWTIGYAIFISIFIVLTEPVFLMIFKATPGKFIFGLKAEHESGRSLTYIEGVKRTAGVMIYGLGLNIPILDIIRLCFSYDTYSKGTILVWDRKNMSRINADDMNKWRVVLGIIILIVFEIFSAF